MRRMLLLRKSGKEVEEEGDDTEEEANAKMRMKMMPRRSHGVFFSVKHRGSTPRRRSYKTQGEDDEDTGIEAD